MYGTIFAGICGVILLGMVFLLLATFCKMRARPVTPLPSPAPPLPLKRDPLELLEPPPPARRIGSAPRKLQYRSQTLVELREEVIALTRPIVAELKSYSNPPAAVHKTMIAVFVMLGESEKKLAQWNYILQLLNKPGKASLMSRISDFSRESVSKGTVERARKQLDNLTSVEVESAGKSVSCLFLWVAKACEM